LDCFTAVFTHSKTSFVAQRISSNVRIKHQFVVELEL
jgi:hypothetical protein